jgi:hypothetical protein
MRAIQEAPTNAAEGFCDIFLLFGLGVRDESKLDINLLERELAAKAGAELDSQSIPRRRA